MKVSVIIPTYNRSSYLLLTLNSLLNQSIGSDNYEIIVADNNSTDNTRSVIDEFISANSRHKVRCFTELRQGVHYARNSAAKLAEGEYLYFTDDDMIADNDTLEHLMYLFTLNPKVVTVTGKVLPKWQVSPPSWVVSLCSNSLLSLNNPPEELIISSRDCNVFSCHQMIKRKIFFDAGGFNPENTKGIWIGDGETGLNIRIMEMGYKFGFNSKSITHHIIPASRMTQKYLNKRLYNEGFCDSYTQYRRLIISNMGLLRLNITFGFTSLKYMYLFLVNYVSLDQEWHIHLAKVFYCIARAHYNFKLMSSASWRELVLKRNWLDQ